MKSEDLIEKLLVADIDTVCAVKARFGAYITNRQLLTCELTYEQRQLAGNAYDKLEKAVEMLELLKLELLKEALN